ncbi:MOSC domain-containing protein [Leptolyngbya sp. NK1-12]|uniref:MOSC domain-containing protein n=1 Tax=Leptolyngbya sp. NK1-12 TaxID=2547451 RepID=A0AA97AL13_9CYAN|nr:MOSC domain-containing protein [Leptolyngbya sp. NK1-12]WNZ24152.1 MOSC domain-containing protein [Leptolyngbya sp. NK1-12]
MDSLQVSNPTSNSGNKQADSTSKPPYLASIQIGLPKSYGEKGAADWMDRPVTTAIEKKCVNQPIWVGVNGLAGDGVGNTKIHGGPERAVLVYVAEHYKAWREELDRPDFPYGAWGENFTVTGQTEETVCIGDTYAVGNKVQIQVGHPRQPCWVLARYWRIKNLGQRLQKSGRTGWACRVLKEGYVEPNLPITLLERPYPQWTITRANQIMYHPRGNEAATAELATCPLLTPEWQQIFSDRAHRGIHPDHRPRLQGPN